MGEEVLAVPAGLLRELAGGPAFQGVLAGPELGRYLAAVLDPGNLVWLDRAAAETDPSHKQLISYVALRQRGLYFRYRRTKRGGEPRLHNQWSVGLGGHVNRRDGAGGAFAYELGFFRELAEEVGLLFKDGRVAMRSVAGLINDDGDGVGRVHLGVVHLLDVAPDADVCLADDALSAGHWADRRRLLADLDTFENWSRLVIEKILT